MEADKRLKIIRRFAPLRTGEPMLVKHSVKIAGHATSVSLEAPFWQALCEIAELRRQSVNTLLAEIDRERAGNLSSAIRLFVLESCRRGELREEAPAAGVARQVPANHPGEESGMR